MGSILQEIVRVEIRLCAYHSPETSGPENETRINNLVKSTRDIGYSHVLLLGDFNHPGIVWNNGCTLHKPNKAANDFINAVNGSYLYRHIEFPTRYREIETSNILDLVLTNGESMGEDPKADTPLGSSDHVVMTVRLICYADIQIHTGIRYLYEKPTSATSKTT